MKKPSNTGQRVAHIQEGMRRAMPEIKRQIAVYEQNLRNGNQISTQQVAVLSRNV